MTQTASQDLAVKYALENNWKQAYEENRRLLAENPDDIDTLNRIAYAAVRLGKFTRAKAYYKEVLKRDKTNPIALKNTKRLTTISQRRVDNNNTARASINLQDVFIEEAGKTKTIELKNVADRKTLSLIQPGDSVILAVKRSKIFVLTHDKTYIGVLPDNVGMRMITFINGGNEYVACIKSVGENEVSVFVKETKRTKRFKNQPTFVQASIVTPVSFTERD